MPAPRCIALLACLLAATLLGATGCATARPAPDPAARTISIFDGESGRPLVWSDVVARAAEADATFVGERHDDPTAHDVQLAVYQDLLARFPGTAIALEHLERDEQPLLERYLRGEMTPAAFIDQTESRDWAGKETWVRFFQPLVDTARENDSPVIAANAPRELVKRARDEGHHRRGPHGPSGRRVRGRRCRSRGHRRRGSSTGRPAWCGRHRCCGRAGRWSSVPEAGGCSPRMRTRWGAGPACCSPW